MSSILLSVLAIIFFINTTNGLECSYCTSGLACRWGLVFDTMPCPAYSNPQCYKISGELGGQDIIIRSCLGSPFGKVSCNDIIKLLNWNVATVDCYTCESNECNSLGRAWSAVIVVAIILVVLGIIGGSIYAIIRYSRINRNRPAL